MKCNDSIALNKHKIIGNTTQKSIRKLKLQNF